MPRVATKIVSFSRAVVWVRKPAVWSGDHSA